MTMNIFRLAGDLSHVFSILILFLRLRLARNSTGISLKTQELFLLVFLTRYLDLFSNFVSLYNTVMKVLYISSTAALVYSMRYSKALRSTYDSGHDTFLHIRFAVIPCAILALILNLFQGFEFLEYMWDFSIFLEAIAIMPQLVMLQRYREIENLTGDYIFFLGAYRALYILNWVYRSYYEPFYVHNWTAYIAGVLQTALYADFFYYYIRSKYYGEKISLPTHKNS
jgi:ER lumen protein retaining receptor